jgi:hypothetical protein
MAEHVGIEPTHRLPSDRLAICCLNRSANAPLLLVRVPGVEPGHLSARDFKSLVSTNFTILANNGASPVIRTRYQSIMSRLL